nr:non-homologous end-joining DNA ligase [Lentzea indica]
MRARWVDPVLVGEVRFRQFTRGEDGRLRHTAWRGLRADRDPSEVTAPRAGRPSPPPADPPEITGQVTVKAGGRTLRLSNLDKPLYPDGTAKSEVIAYYSRIAPILLPHLRGRPVTFVRYPNGVRGPKFFQKNADASAPDWLPTVPLRGGGSRRGADANEVVRYPLLHELAALVWAANLAALELHVPQWTVADDGTRNPLNRLVFDLDPGPGTTIADCCRVAERLHDVLVADGLIPVATTSGSKGLQVYAGIDTTNAQAPSVYAKAIAVAFEQETPEQVTATMTKARREGNVLIDWSQNNPAKTTISPYSLRGRDEPTVATPVTWDEVRGCREPEQLVFTTDDVLERVADIGDLFAPAHERRAPLPGHYT